jgi:hypothetical protein
MSNLRFSSQSACDKFHAKLYKLETSYALREFALDEVYQTLMGDFNYGSKNAVALIETWRVRYKHDEVKFDPRDALGMEREMI